MEKIIDLVVMIVGAGTKHMVSRLLGRFVPIPPDWLGLALGGGLYLFGDRIHPLVRTYGTGLLVASAGQFLAGLIPAAAAPVAAPAVAPLARARGGGGGYYDSPEEYLKAKYGI